MAAYLLKKDGFDVSGVTMCLGVKWADAKKPTCCGAQAVEDAKKVALKLKIPHYVLDFSGHLESRVIDKFMTEHLAGRTPNPCVDCNRHLKFDILLRKALALGFDFLATGHYARIEKSAKGIFLKKAKDLKKDQSYFLYPIRPGRLKNIIFPLGGLTKVKVRAIAKKAGIPVFDKPESQDICFIPDKDFGGFFRRKDAEVASGPIVTLEGDLVGKHKGACFYTIGQRGGLGVGYRHPLYVLSKDMQRNELVVGGKEKLLAKGLVAEDINVFVRDLPKNASAKIRYNQKEARCKVTLIKGNKLKAVFDEAQEAVTPGQSVVFYDGDIVLGGGVIEEKTKWQ